MPGSLLRAFVNGTRQVLIVQLFVSIAAVGLAGWTLGVTSELILERNRLRERVIQLEGEMGARGIMVPPTVVVDETSRRQTAYPGEVGLDRAQRADAPDFDPRQVLSQLFSPAPPMRAIVLHVRSARDAEVARALGEELGEASKAQVIVTVMPARDPRPSGYAYFDGRQGRAAAAVVARFNEIARQREIAPWSAQLRGEALPAAGEYSADRTDIVLPALPEPPRPQPERTTPLPASSTSPESPG